MRSKNSDRINVQDKKEYITKPMRTLPAAYIVYTPVPPSAMSVNVILEGTTEGTFLISFL